MSLINALQIDPTSLALIIQQTASGAAFSGNVVNYVQGGGYLGPNVVSTTGGAQVVLGSLTMANPITVPYVGGSGQSVARKYVDDQIASSSGTLTGAFASLTANQSINGSNIFALPLTVANPTATGHATNLFYVSGVSGALSARDLAISGALQVLINAGGGGGGAPNAVFQSGNQTISGLKTFTGAVSVGVPTATGHAVNLGYLTGVSGILASAGVGPGYSGYVENTFVHRSTIDEAISGAKTFTGALTVGTPLLTGHAVNLGYLTGASGILSARDLAISGALQAQIGGGGGNTFYITGTGTINNTLNASGNQTNTFTVSGSTTNTFNATGTLNNTFNGPVTNSNPISLSGITGNFVNISFYFDQYNLFTGLNQIETFVSRNFFFTGYAAGAITSGTRGILSGSLYQRTPLGSKVNFLDFSLNSGQFFTGVGGFSQVISGMNRVGLDILQLGTGMTGVSIGIFGVGY